MARPPHAWFMTPSDISVVFQGPLVGKPADPLEAQVTRRCVEQLRSLLPGAEIIVSTWAGSDPAGLAVDRVLLQADPGNWRRDDGLPCNVNRQIVSTSGGLAAATRPYALKIRTDTTIVGTGFLEFLQPGPPRDPAFSLFEERILILQKYTRHPGRMPLLHHPSDLFQFGRTSDLRRLWGIPLASAEDTVGWSKRTGRPRLRPTLDARVYSRYADEQYIWTSCVRQQRPLRPLDYFWQCRWSEIGSAEALLANNFLVVSEEQAGVRLPERFRTNHGAPETCYTTAEWERLMALCGPHGSAARRLFRTAGLALGGQRALLGQTAYRWSLAAPRYAAALAATRERRRPAPGAVPDLGAARSILVLKLDALGDFVLATPFLRTLRQLAPQARITLVIRPIALSLARTCPHVDRVLTLDLATGPRRLGEARRVLELGAFLRQAGEGLPPDYVFIPRTGPDHHRARLLAWLSGATVRVGFSTGESDAVAGPAALTHPVDYPASPLPEAEANLLLLRRLGYTVGPAGPLELHAAADDTGVVTRRLREAGVAEGDSILALGVGASLPHKIWPEEHYKRLAGEFVARPGWRVVVLGDASDRTRVPGSGSRCLNWAGETTPVQSWALLRQARLFVGNDSGTLHLAAAAGCPIVGISWDHALPGEGDVNDHRRFRPHGVPHLLLHPAATEGRHAANVDYGQVLAACEDLLARTTAAPRS